MVTYLVDSKADIAKAQAITQAIEDGSLPAAITITKRPADFQCWQGTYYAGQWYPPSDPRGAELAKMRYMLPAPKNQAPLTVSVKSDGRHKPKTNRAGDENASNKYDRCQTPPYALDPLKPYLFYDWAIWEPACGDGLLADALRNEKRLKTKRNVIATDIQSGQNFFDYKPDSWDCIVTNPPYSIKYKWLERCYELGKPFALLVPVETLGSKQAQVLFKKYGGPQIMLLDQRVDFKMPNKGWDGSSAQFPVMWLCWKLLPQPIMFGSIEESKKAFKADQTVLNRRANTPQVDKTAPISSETPKAPVIPPQALQSKEEALEAIAMSKVIPTPERLTELYEAVEFGVENYENEDARIIFDGYYLEKSENGAYIYLKHREHPNRVVVGAADILTHEMEFVSDRAELRDYMHRVAAGMKPADNPKLLGVMMQAPIPEEAKQPPLRSGGNGAGQFADETPVEELPMFSGDDPESAA